MSRINKRPSLWKRRKPNADPTKTGGVLRSWTADINRRFNKLKRGIREAIVDKDVFGLRDGFFILEDRRIVLKPRQFQYTTDQARLDGFLTWLDEAVDSDILEVVERRGPSVEKHSGWQNKYIRASYDKGVQSSRNDMRSLGVGLVDSGVGYSLQGAYHAPTIASLYARDFSELKGISAAMSQQIGRVLSEGLGQGKNPHVIARMLNNRVDAIGIQRARLLARTETAYARNVGAIKEMEYQEGVINEEIYVQWETTGDDRVRPTHQERRGRVFTKKEVLELLGEPNCRCNLLPFITSMQGLVSPRSRLPEDKQQWPRDVIEEVSVVEDTPDFEHDFPVPGQENPFELPYEELEALEMEWRDAERALEAEWKQVEQAQAERLALEETAYGTPEWVEALAAYDRALARYVQRAEDARNLKHAWLHALPPERYEYHRRKLVGTILGRSYYIHADSAGRKSMTPFSESPDRFQRVATRKVVYGTKHMPYDILEDLERTGLRINFSEGSGRADYNQAWSGQPPVINLYENSNRNIVSHEFAHAIDGGALGKFQSAGGADSSGSLFQQHTSTGFQWANNEYVSEADAADLLKEYKSLAGPEAVNGDGRYYTGNWLDEYEGRIYDDGPNMQRDGVEWWAMNVERHHEYAVLSSMSLEDFSRGEISQVQLATQLQDAAEVTKWSQAQKAYPKLSKLIVRLFAGRFARDMI